MRITRLLALGLIAGLAPWSRGSAQTCQGLAAFQDGPIRAGAAFQGNGISNEVSAGFALGLPRSFYGGVNVDELTPNGGSSSTGLGVNVGYQIHVYDTPFQFCPSATAHFGVSDMPPTNGGRSNAYGLGGSLGYRVGISDWLTIVPAAGARWTTTSISAGGGTTSDTDVFMAMGFVFNKSFTIDPGVVVPSTGSSKSSFAIGASINWGK